MRYTCDLERVSLRTAADAMGWQKRTGQIAPGLSADLILLEKNPLETVANLRTIKAVMIRGIWLPEPHDAAGYAQSSMSLALWIAFVEDLVELNDQASY